jgi:hypothetical protein
MDDRNGKRTTRDKFVKRTPSLGNYLVMTDTNETEKNYLCGLRDSMSNCMKNELVITVKKSKTCDLVEETLENMSLSNQYREPWIVFDRDEVMNFDEIIKKAENENIHVGWSNPCIEIWFHAYFGEMPTDVESKKCCASFEKSFFDKTHKEYRKADTEIYKKLIAYGNETEAIKCAKEHLASHKRNGKKKPSEQCPGTKLFELIAEIQQKKSEAELKK